MKTHISRNSALEGLFL